MNPLQLKDRSEPNDQAACANRRDFDASRTTVVTFVGPAGSGKTSIIEELMLRLAPPLRAAAMICNLAADRQISRITRHGYPAVAVKTDHISAVRVREALPKLGLTGLDLLLIEADGNALNPAELDLGHHFRIGVFSAAGGDDKVNEFPSLVAGSNLVLLTKIDLLSFVKFDLDSFSEDIARIKANLPIIQASVQSGQGIQECVEWMESRRWAIVVNRGADRIFDPFVNWSRK
jgi:hydrogenase nickel incorporation protein HypB